ncbi:hypothetical protein DDE82_000952 [Stemphylium lycopersici]|uniref:Uncharacterized protein n=1 Tax=Stemphylium lycopersici TaxID=183478 RepID=A0A364NEH6_STELY|nr:hypothetical protein TW65_05819 [Stemphylium lycopersici]RAR10980.1 hypothetical protein DDE82_000952 [Stemphylium lycopersici]RAR15724.1 hypothetical protein DDE83_000956 [Stemphylium lycopersici]
MGPSAFQYPKPNHSMTIQRAAKRRKFLCCSGQVRSLDRRRDASVALGDSGRY